MPFLKGSDFELGKVRTMWEGASINGMKLIELSVRCMAGLNSLLSGMVNSPHLRNAENARATEASELSFPSWEECIAASMIALSMLHVIRSFGLL